MIVRSGNLVAYNISVAYCKEIINENLKIIENLVKIESLTEVDVRARNDNSSRG